MAWYWQRTRHLHLWAQTFEGGVQHSARCPSSICSGAWSGLEYAEGLYVTATMTEARDCWGLWPDLGEDEGGT